MTDHDSATPKKIWHACGWDMQSPDHAGMVEVLDEDSMLICHAKDRNTANEIAACHNRGE
jgi:hypothetical protein